MKTILNIAAGKMKPLGIELLKDYFLVNLDTMYNSITEPEEIELYFDDWKVPGSEVYYTDENAFSFIERTRIPFDEIVCYRFLEHVKKTDVLYFIYLMSTCLKMGGTIDIIVPNYKKLAQMIMTEDDIIGNDKWEAHDIELTYELLNDPSCAHASIWTPARMKYFFGLEKRFVIEHMDDSFHYDGRDIYLRAIIKRVM